MAATSNVSTKFTAIDNYTRKVQRMSAATSTFATKARVGIARADRSFRKLTSPIRAVTRQLGQLGLVLGATAVIGVVGNAINTFKDFEQANANLAAVLGKSVQQTKALQNNAKQLGATTAFTASQVTGLQTEYAKLGFTEQEILKVTQGTLSLAAATQTELPQAAKQVGAAVRAFGLDASEAGRVADVFAASTSKSALDMEKLDVAMSKVAPVAKQFGFSIEDTTALLGTLSNAGFDASTMATSTRSLLLNLADANGKLAKQLGGPARNFDDISAAMVELQKKGVSLGEMLGATDKRSVAAFATLLEGSEKTAELQKALNEAAGTAQAMADKQLDTLQGSLTKLSSAYEGFILSVEDGQGSLGSSLRTIVDVATEMLSLASGSATASSELSKKEKVIRRYAQISITVLKTIGYITAALLAFKAAIIAAKVVMVGYNIVMGVMGAVTGTASVAIGQSTVALLAYKIATAAVTAAQWLWNAAMTANPIGLIIAGVAALIAVVALVITKWDEWGAALSFVLGPIGLIISLIQSFRRNWDKIKEAFATGGIVAGLKMIGVTILDAILMPLQQLLEVLSAVPGIGDFAAAGAASLENFRSELGVELGGGQENEPINPRAAQNNSFSESVNRQMFSGALRINDDSGRAEVEEESAAMPIILTQTGGF